MPRLRDDQCYQIVKAVDVGPILSAWDRLPFFSINHNLDGSDPNKPPCDVVLQDKYPPEIREFIVGLALGGRLGRSVIRRLDPGRGIPAHTDAWMPGELNWRRFQVPLVTHPDIVMCWRDYAVTVHLEVGKLYEVRFDRTHEVINPTASYRTHLQIDQIDATI